jgi:hypothetical protein
MFLVGFLQKKKKAGIKAGKMLFDYSISCLESNMLRYITPITAAPGHLFCSS